MSLTSRLKDPHSSVAQFFRNQFPYTRSLVQSTNRELSELGTIKPGAQVPYSTIGTALDYRIRYYFAATPSEKLVAWRGAMVLTGELRKAVRNSSGRLEIAPLDPTLSKMNATVHGIVPGFFSKLEGLLTHTRPAGRRLGKEQEELLARYCVGLAFFEQVFRRGTIPQDSPLISPAPVRTADELLARVQEPWIDDLRQLSYAFYDAQSEITSEPTVLNPNFDGSLDVGGADADLIVDNCLVDIKTTINPKLSTSWLYQLLGYVFLDYSDRFQIREVSIYFARQKELIRWPLDSLIETMAGKNISLNHLRERFQLATRGETDAAL